MEFSNEIIYILKKNSQSIYKQHISVNTDKWIWKNVNVLNWRLVYFHSLNNNSSLGISVSIKIRKLMFKNIITNDIITNSNNKWLDYFIELTLCNKCILGLYLY